MTSEASEERIGVDDMPMVFKGPMDFFLQIDSPSEERALRSRDGLVHFHKSARSTDFSQKFHSLADVRGFDTRCPGLPPRGVCASLVNVPIVSNPFRESLESLLPRKFPCRGLLLRVAEESKMSFRGTASFVRPSLLTLSSCSR